MRLVPAAVVAVALLLPASVLAQATRTWISGVGDDVNPCSRTAPCKTFPGAISKTAAGGEIDALDPGGFGGVTVTKSITLDGGAGQNASILVAGTPGITVNAGATGRVIIRNLGINGINATSAGAGGGTIGVNVISAASVHLQNDHIFGFTGNGVSFNSTAPFARMTIDNSTIEDNTGSAVAALSGTAGGPNQLMVRDSLLDGNGCGLTVGTLTCGSVSQGNALGVLIDSVNTQITNSGFGAGAGATGAGIYAVGSVSQQVLSGDMITGNRIGLDSVAGGTIFSFSNNELFGNNTNGAPSTTVLPKFKSGPAAGSKAKHKAKHHKAKHHKAKHHKTKKHHAKKHKVTVSP
jgi:hypothetical protein